jgi:hypothetical protein
MIGTEELRASIVARNRNAIGPLRPSQVSNPAKVGRRCRLGPGLQSSRDDPAIEKADRGAEERGEEPQYSSIRRRFHIWGRRRPIESQFESERAKRNARESPETKANAKIATTATIRVDLYQTGRSQLVSVSAASNDGCAHHRAHASAQTTAVEY